MMNQIFNNEIKNKGKFVYQKYPIPTFETSFSTTNNLSELITRTPKSKKL